MNEFQLKVLQATRRFMKPVARILLRSGIGYREFTEVVKAAFVEVATREYGLRGRRTNISRVAVMTGLTRKEVKRVRDKLDADPRYVLDLKRTPAAEVLHAWHTDMEFIDAEGIPKELLYETSDEDQVSFVALTKKYAGDIPPGAVLTELRRAAVVEEGEPGRLRVLKRHFIPYEQDENLIAAFNESVYYLLSSIDFNVNPEHAPMRRTERLVSTDRLEPKAVSRFRKFARVHISKFSEFVDDWLATHEVQRSEEAVGKTKKTGIGIYYYEEE